MLTSDKFNYAAFFSLLYTDRDTNIIRMLMCMIRKGSNAFLQGFSFSVRVSIFGDDIN